MQKNFTLSVLNIIQPNLLMLYKSIKKVAINVDKPTFTATKLNII